MHHLCFCAVMMKPTIMINTSQLSHCQFCLSVKMLVIWGHGTVRVSPLLVYISQRKPLLLTCGWIHTQTAPYLLSSYSLAEQWQSDTERLMNVTKLCFRNTSKHTTTRKQTRGKNTVHNRKRRQLEKQEAREPDSWYHYAHLDHNQ